MRSGNLTLHIQLKLHHNSPPNFSLPAKSTDAILMIETGSGPSFQTQSLSMKVGLTAMSEGVSCACLAIYWIGSNCLVYSLWRKRTAGTLSFKVTNDAKNQRTSVTEKRTGALRQVWTEGPLADILMYVILPLWSCHVSQIWLCGLVVTNSQSHSCSPSGIKAHLLQLV